MRPLDFARIPKVQGVPLRTCRDYPTSCVKTY
jgi:hypothetical protein